jgi:CDGSH-type Zn-finger protein
VSDKPTIKPAENGPYLIKGNAKITRVSDGKVFEVKGRAALCRCGGSKNKPFCDGTHAKIGFKSAKDPERVPDKREDYKGKNITIHDNRGLCAHSGRCTDNLKSVFKLRQEPWIDPDGATAEEIVRVVSMCPSGALSYSIGGKEQRERGGEPQILLAPNGPYAIKGAACELEGVELLEGATLDHFDLCRCGRSKNKPFCSGAHWYVHFDEHAPAPDSE